MKINTKMTDSEIIKELKSINAIIDSNSPRYLKKFSKKLNSKEYKHKDVLGVGEYKINENKVLICFQKFVITDESPYLWITHIVITEDNGAFITAKNEWGNFCFYHITYHAVGRMLERTGLTINDFFVDEFVIKADATFHLERYKDHGHHESTHIMTAGRCFFIVEKENNKIKVVTTIDYSKLYLNQKRLYIDSMRGAYEFAEKMYCKIADSLKGTGFKKRNDAVRGLWGYSSVGIAG